MNSIDTGGPAYPIRDSVAHDIAFAAISHMPRNTNEEAEAREKAYTEAKVNAAKGATLLDLFAIEAMRGLMLRFNCPGYDDADLPAASYRIAKAMIAHKRCLEGGGLE